MIIYKLTFQCGKAYIGQTVRKLKTRLAQHRQSVRLGSMLAVHCAWRVYGEPDVLVLQECGSQSCLNNAERQLIVEHKPMAPNGYNVSTGGDTAPSKTASVAAKISQKAKGRKHSPEVLATISERSKASWQSDEYRQKVSLALRAAASLPDAKARRSELSKELWRQKFADGWKMPESTRAKLAAREISDETRKRMSEAAKNRVRAPHSDATKKKMAENARRQHASMTPEQKAEQAQKIRAGQSASKVTQQDNKPCP